MLDNSTKRFNFHGDLVTSTIGTFDDIATSSKKYYHQSVAEIKILNIVLEYLKDDNKVESNTQLNHDVHGSLNIIETATTNNNKQVSTTSTDLTPTQYAVLNLLQATASVTGSSVQEICAQLSEYEIKQVLGFLSDRGHIYPTTQVGHFRARDAHCHLFNK